jgi:hypothetical protein
LLSINQLYDKGYNIVFYYACCLILENDKVIFVENKKGNVYKININACMRIESFLVANIYNSFLWNRRLCHISMDILSKLLKNELVKGFSHIAFKKKKPCDTCQIGKQVKTKYNLVKQIQHCIKIKKDKQVLNEITKIISREY